MFDFFRKDKGSPKPAVPDMPAVPSPSTAAGPTSLTGAPGVGMLVEESDLNLAPEVEEAVMLYANGRTGEATAALNRYILNNPASRDPQPWRLLFDLYEVTGQRQPFEDLALDYAVRFESSPPTWPATANGAGASKCGDHPCFAFGARLTPEDRAALDHFLRECQKSDTAVLDFSKTPVPDTEAYARALLDCVSRLATAGKTLQLPGVEAFTVRLDASRAGGKLGEPLWLLLLLLLQLQGRAEEFEAAALDYAIRFEISPPSYTPPRQPARTPVQAAPDIPTGVVFPLRGMIGPAEASVFNELRDFALPLPGVEVDLSRVTRIDFMVVGLLMDTVMSLAQAGRPVVFKDGNELVNLLLHLIGIGQLATIQPRMRK